MTFAYRTIWISDIHLGARSCKADLLLKFLKDYKAQTIFLVGDIIDFWRLKAKPYWPEEHNTVIQKLLRKSRHGVTIHYIPGNHDDFFRQFSIFQMGGINFHLGYEYTLANGSKCWITHGDQIDSLVQTAEWLCRFGSFAYELSQCMNGVINWVRKVFGLPYWSLSGFLKNKVKNASNFIHRFETALVKTAKDKKYSAVVCGHIHQGDIKKIDNVWYLNCSDWCDSMGGLIEHWDGTVELIQWQNGEWAVVKQAKI
jgi:UDP-2,3-diacylglucosamine pyrophosphatase LpxH